MKIEPTNNDIQNEPAPPWWTASGWQKKAAPEVYRDMFLKAETDWEKLLQETGYKSRAYYGGKFDPLQIKVYECRTEEHPYPVLHLFVEIWDESEGQNVSLFFVEAEDEKIFFATWYPNFLKEAAALQQAIALERIAKTLTAFVRHGHGDDTIDEFGHQSYDDHQSWLKQQRRASK